MQTKKTLRVGIVVGEHSGDLLGSELINSLKNENENDIELFGIGGPRLSELGLKSEFDFKKINVMGLVEPIKNFRELNKLRKNLISLFEDKEIDYFIGVDSPDFNISIHKQLKKKGHTKNIQLVSPSVWVWRQGRLKHIRSFIDMTVCLFNFEHEFYQKENLQSIHLGHPFAHLKKENMEVIFDKYNLSRDKQYVSILPGSRKSEINNLLPTYLDFIKEHSEKYSNYEYLIPAADSSSMQDIKNIIPSSLPIHVNQNCSKDFLSVSDYSIVTSGTATLEAAVLSCNPIICYKTSFINYAIISRMLKIDNVGLPNLLLGSRVFPELIQSDCNTKNLMKEAKKMQEGSYKNNYASKLQDLLLGEGFQETAKKIKLL